MRYSVMIAALAMVACSSAEKESPPVSPDVPVVAADDASAPVPSDPVPVPDDGNFPVADASVPTPVVVDAATPDTGTDAATDASVPVLPTLASCLSDCEVKYPVAAAKGKVLDACFVGATCGAVCDNLGNSKVLFPPSAVATVSCDTAAAGSDPLVTGNQACSDCLATDKACCADWISIFGSVDGRALNACANTCYTKFP